MWNNCSDDSTAASAVDWRWGSAPHYWRHGSFIHVSERDPLRARLTADVDAAIERQHLPAIIEAAREAGLVYRQVAGVDMLADGAQPKARSAAHLPFFNEKVKLGDLEAIPASDPVATQDGILVAPVNDLVHMKLTSYRLKDCVHLQHMDAVSLITTEIEAGLAEPLRAGLAEVRASE